MAKASLTENSDTQIIAALRAIISQLLEVADSNERLVDQMGQVSGIELPQIGDRFRN